MRSPYEIAISVQSPEDIGDPLHCEITVAPAVNSENCDEFFPAEATDEQVDAALREIGLHNAGIFGRLAAELTGWVDWERGRHGCARMGMAGGVPEEPHHPPSWWESCHITPWGLLNPTREECRQPNLWFYVPAGERKAWLARIASALDTIGRSAG